MIIWLASYPRSGNTFFRVILKSIFDIQTYSIYNDNDIGSDMETSNIVGHSVLPENFSLENARKNKTTYYIKTHEHYDKRISTEDKVIYLIRDGRESTLSFTKHQNIYGKKNKTLLDTIYGNTWIGSWGEHVRSWEKFPREKILYINFEALTDHPLEQLETIAKFLNISAINNRIPTFEELKAINPKFFRSGQKDSWENSYSKEEHMAFWYKHSKVMKKYGYMKDIPDIFKSKNIEYLYKAIDTDNTYNKNKMISSQTVNHNEIKKLKYTFNNGLAEKLCFQMNKNKAIEKKLNTMILELDKLTKIKFYKHPIQKYYTYKNMLHLHYTQIKQPYKSKKSFFLPSDDLNNNPDNFFCITEEDRPIIIYQVGKVGSSAIYQSLKQQTNDLPIYQVHNIAHAETLLTKDSTNNIHSGMHHFTIGMNLKKIIDNNDKIHWQIIVGVREPISRWISDVFENIHTRYKFLKNDDNSINIEKTIQFIKDTISDEPQEKWFEDELINTFGIKLFDKPFNENYQITHYKKLDLLIYRFENMQHFIPSAIKTFLNLKDFKLQTANVTSQKSTADAYKKVKEQLNFEKDFLDDLYKKSVVSHFYTPQEIELFKKRWSSI